MITKIQKSTLALGSFIILGLLLRFYRLAERFNFDAELNVKSWTIKKLLVDREFPLVGIEAVSYLHHLFYPPLFQFIGAGLFFISGLNPIIMEIFLILLFIPSMFALYLITKSLSGKMAAYIAMTIYTLSFFVNLASRFIWVVGPMLLIGLSNLFLITRIGDKPRLLKNYLFLGIILGIGFNFHYQTFIIFFSVLIWMLIQRKKIPRVKPWLMLLLPIAAAFLPLVVFDLRHDFFNLRGIFLLISANKTNSFWQNIINTHYYYTKPFVEIFSLRFPQILSVAGYVPLLTSIVLYIKTKNQTRKIYLFMFLNFLLTLLALPLIQNRFYSSQYYVYFLIPSAIILFSVLLKMLYEKKQFLLLAFFFFLFFYENISMYKNYSLSPNYQAKIIALEKILRHKPPLIIYSSDIASEKYSYLLYYLARKNHLNYDAIKIYEPWQLPKKWQVKISRSLFE